MCNGFFERIVDKDEAIGIMLMAELYKYADRDFYHDVCESIDLRVRNSDLNIESYFLQMIANADYSSLIRHALFIVEMSDDVAAARSERAVVLCAKLR